MMSEYKDYRILCLQVQDIARGAGRFIREERQKITVDDVELKSAASLVTYVDRNSEDQIVRSLSKLIPESGFITEEGTGSWSGERYRWIIDPLDGTTNFIHGIMPHAVSIALMDKEELVLGVVYEIGQDEMFYSWKGAPALLNDREIRVATSSNPENILIGTDFPYNHLKREEDYNAAMQYLLTHTRGLRRLGSAATDLVYVAAGRFDVFLGFALNPWDVAAGGFILNQAGGTITDFNGSVDWLTGREILAASKSIYGKVFPVIHRHLGT
jgi:myo-inositol-1(or 4)-monophosphatase